MQPVRSFVVDVHLPEPIAGLREVALDLRWIWHRSAQELFRRVDPTAWDLGRRDPMGILLAAGRHRLAELAADDGYVKQLTEVRELLRATLDDPRWFQQREGSPLRSVAYFSPEFGLAEAIPQYSGGLGVLAGDHLKTADDLGLPLMGVGLLYRHGYFRQELDADGWQRERYPDLDPHGMALSPVDDVFVEVELAGEAVAARIWVACIGRVPLYLLDANLEGNSPGAREVTDRLYGGGQEHRLRQEILLGIGGVRALAGVGADVQLFHTNEGHAGFLSLERIRRFVTEDGLSFVEAVEAVRAGTLFTTHTSVPAGIDRFPRELMERYFSGWVAECGIGFDELMELGREPGDDAGEVFNMAAMGFHLSGTSNGVSQLHGDVSRGLFAGLWPGAEVDDVPIQSVTNGVHARTWVSEEMDDLLVERLGPFWPGADEAAWAGLRGASDEDIWTVRKASRGRMIDFVRHRVRELAADKGASDWDLGWCDELLDPDVLTIGFARRFAGYKRATLLLSDPERLRALLLDADRPVQILFSGKAHPADDGGKEMIRQIAAFSRDPAVRARMVFVETYDIGLARMLVQGCDVWLNTPRRPHEASGTSGMKAAINGGLNLSVLDGWWDEMFDGRNGWAIPSAEGYADPGARDDVEATALFDLLEQRVAPLFYERGPHGLPSGWIGHIRDALCSLGPRVGAERMLREYVARLYEPSAARHENLAAGGYRRARALAGWKDRVRRGWDGVGVEGIEDVVEVADLGAKRTVTCTVRLGELGPQDVQVQVIHGPVDPEGQLSPAGTVVMEARAQQDGGITQYAGSFAPERAGRYGFAIRVVPSHPDLVGYAELGLSVWA